MSTIQVANLTFESTQNTRIQYLGSNSYALMAAGANVVYVAANGNVGFGGNTTPLDTVSVSGTLNVVNSISSVLYVASNGNVGISGNTTPTTDLAVMGTTYLQTDLTVGNNVAVGNNNYGYGSIGVGGVPGGQASRIWANTSYSGDATLNQVYSYLTVQNATVTAARSYIGFRSFLNNFSLQSNGSSTFGSDAYGFYNLVYNGGTVIGGDAYLNNMYGTSSILRNYANGTSNSTVDFATGGYSSISTYNAGEITTARGFDSRILPAAANSLVTGNIGTAFAYSANVGLNSGNASIGTGYLYYGVYPASANVTGVKYGVYMDNENTNYFSGNVGIGTSSPAYPLDVSGTGVARINPTTGTNQATLFAQNMGGYFYFGKNNSAGTSYGTDAYASVLWSSGAYPMVMATNGTERMRIDAGGSVGIGNASPAATLHVQSNTSIATVAQFANATTTLAVINATGLSVTGAVLSTGLVNASAFTTTGNANATNHYAGANALFNSTSLAWTGNTTTSPTITLANTGAFTIGNSSTTQTTGSISVANSAGNVQITAGATSILATGLVNASAFTTTGNANATNHYAGANAVFNSTNLAWTGNTTTSPTVTLANTGAFTIGNSSTTQTTGSMSVANSAGNVQITAGATSILATGLVNASAFTTTGNANAANHYSGANAVFNSTSLAWTGNTTTSPTVTLANTGAFTIGNSSTTQTTGSISVANSAGNVQITAGAVSINATGSVNALSLAAAGVVVANSTTLNGNSVVINSTAGFFTGYVNASAFTTTGNANATNFNSGANLVVNSTSLAWTGNTTTSPTITLANTGAFTIGNSSTTQTAATVAVANSTGNVRITAGAVSINATGSISTSSNASLLTNGTRLTFTPLAGGSNVYFTQQNDDNFVFYSTNTTNGSRAIWNVFANSTTSNLQVSVPLQVSTNLTVSTNTFTLGTSSVAANGYSRLPNGLLMQWGNDSRTVNATTTNTTTFPVAFTTLHSVTAISRDTGTTAAVATLTVTALGTTTFTWRNYSAAAAAASSIYYVAIGT